MQRQTKRVTNLFCIIGKPGTGKQYILDNLFSNARFIDKYEISKFIYGTTRENLDEYEFPYDAYSMDEYREIDPNEVIESRSYDDIISGELFYEFTLEKHMKNGNMIGIATIFQFEEIKKWAQIKQMEDLLWEINIYPIYINSPLSDRIKRLLSDNKMEDKYIYRICSDIISERYEYRPVMENKVIDRSDPKVLYIHNAGGTNQLPKIYKEVKLFIERHCI